MSIRRKVNLTRPVPEPSYSLGEEILFLICEGQASCKTTSRIARSISKTFKEHIPEVVKKLGDMGKSKSNVERNLISWSHRQAWRELLPMPFDFMLHIKARKRPTGSEEKKHSVLLPHEVFANFYRTAPDLFKYLFLGPDGNIQDSVY